MSDQITKIDSLLKYADPVISQILDKAIGLFFADQLSSFIEQNKNTKLKRPNNWGGIEIFINQIEFWQGRKNRLHNRVLCNFQKDTWDYKLLSPYE